MNVGKMMKTCTLLLATSAFLLVPVAQASAAMAPVYGAVLNVDVWSEWIGDEPDEIPHPDFTQFFNVVRNSSMDRTHTFGAVTMTLDGTWGGRNRGPYRILNDGVFTDHDMLISWGKPFDDDADVGTSDRTVTITGLTAGLTYLTSLWAWEAQDNYGFDLLANGVLVVDDFMIDSTVTTNDDSRMDFEATADAAGTVVFTYTDPTTTSTVYYLSGLRMTPIPEPGSIVLLALGTLGLVALRGRKRGAA
jgi:hypothetical protein